MWKKKTAPATKNAPTNTSAPIAESQTTTASPAHPEGNSAPILTASPVVKD